VLEKNVHYRTKIALGHLPLFPVAVQRANEHIYDKELVDLFQDYQLDLYLAAQHHAYYPAVSEGITQVVQACLG
jgi:hypothetical protein